jgi:hypothetical protein
MDKMSDIIPVISCVCFSCIIVINHVYEGLVYRVQWLQRSGITNVDEGRGYNLGDKILFRGVTQGGKLAMHFLKLGLRQVSTLPSAFFFTGLNVSGQHDQTAESQVRRWCTLPENPRELKLEV